MSTVKQALELAVKYHQAGHFERAEQLYAQVLRADPAQADALHLLGVLARQQGQHERALGYLEKAVHLRPLAPEVHSNLGNALKALDRTEEALVCYREALRLRPDYAEAHNNLGNTLLQLGRPSEAEDALRQALRLRPHLAETHNNLGKVLTELSRYEEALACHRRAVELQPDFAEGHNDLALLLLLTGDLERGWREYEWRLHGKEKALGELLGQRWDGGPLKGRTVLLHAEQGLGDTLQFVRYAPLVKQRGGNVLLVCPAPLCRVLASAPGIDRLMPAAGPPPPGDVYAPLLSVPGLLGTRLDSIPARVPYLSAEPERVRRWGAELARLPGLRVGVVWQGNPGYTPGRRRSFPLRCLEPLARVNGATLISLQKGPGAEQIEELDGGFSVVHLGVELDAAAAFVDTAAILANLDLLVTCDTSVAHLAGALGVRTWVALPHVPDWRWLLKREDSPWYPSLRLFRQPVPGDWPPVFERMAEELRGSMATTLHVHGASS